DVIVELPHRRSVIIDSKVSLTAYTSAIEAENDPSLPSTGEGLDRARHFMSEHARSVRRHVDELAAKSYADLQPGSIDMVLMFLPTDSALIAALRQQPDLGEYAFNRKVVIITPTNLMMTLKLIHNLWQQERQQQNVEKIVSRGNELYNRMAGFIDSFGELQTHIDRMQRCYVTAEKRLTGRGGVVSQFEMLRKLGLTPKKQIKGATLTDDMADDVSDDATEVVADGLTDGQGGDDGVAGGLPSAADN
ncbi:MAG: DNA recombination protein RmuC, partial [Muribaculaceae bacterium]|nr:DNA recombination protein RmuC [Muribaculaceae bacterium]